MKIEHARTITRFRRRVGLNKTAMAKRLGVSRDTVTRIEGFCASEPTDRYPYLPSLPVAIKLSQFLNVPVQDLVTRKDVEQGRKIPAQFQAQPLSIVPVSGTWPFATPVPTAAD